MNEEQTTETILMHAILDSAMSSKHGTLGCFETQELLDPVKT